LLVGIGDRAELELLGHELRRTHVEMHVDAVLVLGEVVLEIVREAEHGGEFVPGLRIERVGHLSGKTLNFAQCPPISPESGSSVSFSTQAIERARPADCGIRPQGKPQSIFR
jgi:hypothetical protein